MLQRDRSRSLVLKPVEGSQREVERRILQLCVRKDVGVSRRWMEYAFRDALGESPYQYIRRRRLKLAQRLLDKQPPAKVYEIARQTGFSSAKQFSMAFSQEFGASPRECQRSRAR